MDYLHTTVCAYNLLSTQLTVGRLMTALDLTLMVLYLLLLMYKHGGKEKVSRFAVVWRNLGQIASTESLLMLFTQTPHYYYNSFPSLTRILLMNPGVFVISILQFRHVVHRTASRWLKNLQQPTSQTKTQSAGQQIRGMEQHKANHGYLNALLQRTLVGTTVSARALSFQKPIPISLSTTRSLFQPPSYLQMILTHLI